MILKAFDYIFYRVATFYRDRWNAKEPERFGFGVVLLLQMTTFGGLFLILVAVAGPEYMRYSKEIGIALAIALFALDFIRYPDSAVVAKYERQFGVETRIQRRNRRIAMKLYAFISIAIPIAYSVLKHNLHWI